EHPRGYPARHRGKGAVHGHPRHVDEWALRAGHPGAGGPHLRPASMPMTGRPSLFLSLIVGIATSISACDRGGLSAEEAANLTGGGVAARGADAVQRFGCG